MVHYENEVPVQIEDRCVNAAVVPDYLHQDYTATTPHDYLSLIAPLTEGEHIVEAAGHGGRVRAAAYSRPRSVPADPSSHLVDNPHRLHARLLFPVADIVCRGALAPDPRWRQQNVIADAI